VRGYQAQQGREISRCLKELRQLRKDAPAEGTDEPEEALRNEPETPPAPANDDASIAWAPAEPADATTSRNEPGPPAAGDVWVIDGAPLLDVWGQPRPHPLAAARAGSGVGDSMDGGATRLAG
jgi:hypothetical protein